MPAVRKKKRRPSVTRRARIFAVVCGLVAMSLVIGGLYLKQQERLDANAAEAANYRGPASAAPSTSGSTSPPVTVGILSDSHAYNADSWWRQTVNAGTVAGVSAGPFESQPGALTTSLIPRIDDAVNEAQYVVVQAGTNDLITLKGPQSALDGIDQLVRGIRDRGAQPIVALVPPSDTRGGSVVALNDMVSEYAARESIPVLDLTSSVSNADGTWRAGLTDDGVHANRSGSDLMADAAAEQIPEVLGL